MKWLLNLSMRAKIFAGFGLMLVLLAAVIGAAYSGIASLRSSQTALYREDFLPALELIEMRSDQNRVRAQILEMSLTRDRAKQQALERDIRDRSDEVDAGLAVISASLQNDPAELQKLEELKTVRAAYVKTRDKQIDLIAHDRYAEAQTLGTTIQDERYNRIRDLAIDLGDAETASAKTRVAEAEARSRTWAIVFAAAAALALALSFWMARAMNALLAAPLREITAVAERIAAGDLSNAPGAVDRRDEVGVLTGAFIRMIENLRSVTRQIQESVEVLVSSTGEILATTTQVASGASEAASSVTETTSTVEEVRQTAQLATEKSRGVSESAQKAVQTARQGSAAVKEAVEGVNRIKTMMDSVAETIVKLSDQTQTIGEIITTVNDLAQQSNLLSVNAAIEASKAGEQGKGFAVVAQEIKSLADQSKQATEQVRAILTDIQKATSAAVMAAEQVSKAVESGVQQTTDSGESIKRLSESIVEAAQAATQIAASSQQQFAGMDQIALAMENIKQAAQQNMAGTKQAEQAAHNLNEVGRKLKAVVAQYRV